MRSTHFFRWRDAVPLFAILVAACTDKVASVSGTDTTSASTSTQPGLTTARWGANVTVSFGSTTMRYRSNGIPNHARQAQYALPNPGVRIPTATTAYAGTDPTAAQSYDFQIPLVPRKAASPTSTSLGTIGVMISGAALYNPYEADNSTVAMASNFTVKNATGANIAFLDVCNGHPTPMGAYHYHALPPCVTAMVDTAGGPSHIIGVAFDGYLIYGDRDISGRQLAASQLDQCSGITSPTPEFPQGIYHYVLLNTSSAASSIRCFTGTLTASATASFSTAMKGMHP
jgi:hypothetical protein